jgi:hypothetical protein
MTEDKPDVVADSVVTGGNTESEEIRQRIAEGIEQQKTGGSINIVDGNPVVAKPSEGSADVAAQVVQSSDSDKNTIALKLIESSTGRKFDKLEDAQKFLTNLNSLVGEQSVAKAREAEKVLSNLSQKFGKSDIKELETYITDIVVNKEQPKVEQKVEPVVTQKEIVDSKLDQRLEKLEHDNQLFMLKEKYPKAGEVAEEVALIAKSKGVSYIEAFETSPLKNLVELKEKDETTKNPIVTPSNRIKVDTKKVEELGKRVLSNKATSEDKESLVSEILGL